MASESCKRLTEGWFFQYDDAIGSPRSRVRRGQALGFQRTAGEPALVWGEWQNSECWQPALDIDSSVAGAHGREAADHPRRQAGAKGAAEHELPDDHAEEMSLLAAPSVWPKQQLFPLGCFWISAAGKCSSP